MVLKLVFGVSCALKEMHFQGLLKVHLYTLKGKSIMMKEHCCASVILRPGREEQEQDVCRWDCMLKLGQDIFCKELKQS